MPNYASLLLGVPLFLMSFFARSADIPFNDHSLQSDLGFSEGYISVGDIKIHYVEKGAGKPVLFIHGFPDFWYSWRHVARNFPEGYRVILVDLPGFNKSGKPAETDFYRVENVATVLKAFADKVVGNEKLYLVAQDWGGSVAWAMGQLFPESIAKMAVLNNPYPKSLGSLNQEEQLRFAKAVSYILWFKIPHIAELRLRAGEYQYIRDFFAKGKFSPEEIDIFIHAIAEPGALTAGLNYYRANVSYLSFVSKNRVYDPYLQSPLAVKTLLIWGDDDPVMIPPLADYSKAFLPEGSEVIHLKDCGHFPQTDQPGVVVEKLLEFFGS